MRFRGKIVPRSTLDQTVRKAAVGNTNFQWFSMTADMQILLIILGEKKKEAKIHWFLHGIAL